jgi:hypothetical protein
MESQAVPQMNSSIGVSGLSTTDTRPNVTSGCIMPRVMISKGNKVDITHYIRNDITHYIRNSVLNRRIYIETY